MFITPSFKKRLIVEQFQGNYLKYDKHVLQASERILIGREFIQFHFLAIWGKQV